MADASLLASLLPDPYQQQQAKQLMLMRMGQQASQATTQAPGGKFGGIASALMGLAGGAMQGIAFGNMSNYDNDISKALGDGNMDADQLAASPNPVLRRAGTLMKMQAAQEEAKRQGDMQAKMQEIGATGEQARMTEGVKGQNAAALEAYKQQFPDMSSAGDGMTYNKRTGQVQLPGADVQAYQMGLKQAGKPETNVAVKADLAGQTEYNKKYLGGMADEIQGYQDSATKASETAQNIAQINELLGKTPTGTLLADARGQISKLLGVDQETVGTRENAEALTNKAVLQRAMELKGSISDKDLAFLKTSTAGISQTPAGRAQMAYTLKRASDFANDMNEKAIDVGQRISTGELTVGAGRKALNDWRKELNERYTNSWAPPSDQSSGDASGAPAVPAKRVKIDASGNLVQ